MPRSHTITSGNSLCPKYSCGPSAMPSPHGARSSPPSSKTRPLRNSLPERFQQNGNLCTVWRPPTFHSLGVIGATRRHHGRSITFRSTDWPIPPSAFFRFLQKFQRLSLHSHCPEKSIGDVRGLNAPPRQHFCADVSRRLQPLAHEYCISRFHTQQPTGSSQINLDRRPILRDRSPDCGGPAPKFTC